MMKLSNTRLVALAAAALVTAPLLATPALAKTKGSIEKMEDALAAAGFEPRAANTPQRVDMLSRLPANKFARRAHGDTTTYVWPDAKVCNCIYVGDQAAYDAFQSNKQAKQIADEQRATAEDYQDAQWDWGAWGPWGPRWGGFGFGFGW